jgi:nicotinamidase-related amidase
MTHPINPATTALLLVDLQNDFLHPSGAYGRAGQTSQAIAALPARLLPLAQALRKAGGWIVSTQFTLVPGKAGEPFISDHLKNLRPFLAKGDFLPGGWGHQLVDELQPADITVEKVAYSAFYMSRNPDRGRHRHQWRRRLDRARRPCARSPHDCAVRRLRRLPGRGA